MHINRHNGYSAAGPRVIDGPGILDSRPLPDPELLAQWDAIIVEQAIKDRLLAQAVLNFRLRPRVNRAAFPLHGIILLVGPPGTGKTSLVRGLAARTAESLSDLGEFLYVEVEPHALANAALGRSQKAITELLGTTIAERALVQPLIVLLDEVETLAADRAKMSLEANPIDVHRATDAVLAQLDQLATRFPNLLFLATSNFPAAIDAAFLSRADIVVNLDLPGPEACRAILRNTIMALSEAFPACQAILGDPELERVAELCDGLDGRRVRKLVAAACAERKEVALDPNLLTTGDLLTAARRAQVSIGLTKGEVV